MALVLPARGTLERHVRAGRVALAAGTAVWAAAHLYLAAKADDAFVRDGGTPAGSLDLLGAPVLALAAWSLVVAVARNVVGARWPRLVPAALTVLLSFAVWSNQIPADERAWWYPDLAPTPLAGMPWSPESPRLVVLWSRPRPCSRSPTSRH
jgi:hypothetical protein